MGEKIPCLSLFWNEKKRRIYDSRSRCGCRRGHGRGRGRVVGVAIILPVALVKNSISYAYIVVSTRSVLIIDNSTCSMSESIVRRHTFDVCVFYSPVQQTKGDICFLRTAHTAHTKQIISISKTISYISDIFNDNIIMSDKILFDSSNQHTMLFFVLFHFIYYSNVEAWILNIYIYFSRRVSRMN